MIVVQGATRRGAPARRVSVTTWAVAGVALLFLEAIGRLGERAIVTVAAGIDGPQRLALGVVIAVFGYVEGYRGLQCRFAPRVVDRALAAGAAGDRWGVIVGAPLYALGLFGGPPRAVARSWSGVALIAVAMLATRSLPWPWRGIVDAGVAVALLWGLIAILVRFVAVLRASPARPRAHRQPITREGDPHP